MSAQNWQVLLQPEYGCAAAKRPKNVAQAASPGWESEGGGALKGRKNDCEFIGWPMPAPGRQTVNRSQGAVSQPFLRPFRAAHFGVGTQGLRPGLHSLRRSEAKRRDCFKPVGQPSASPASRSLRLEFANQNAHQHAVIARAAQFFQLGQGLFTGLGGGKRALAGHVHIGVGNGHDARP